MPNLMHRGAGKIAERILGEDTPQTRRIIFRWASEVSPAERPVPIHKDGRTIYVWEHEITAGAASQSAAPTHP